MAHGWNSYFPNFPPRSSDPRSLRRTAESDRSAPQHFGNFTGHHGFSGAVGSRQFPAPNTNFNANYCRSNSFEPPRSDCFYNRYNERQWQGNRQDVARDYPPRYRGRDFPNYASNSFPTPGSYHSSFAPDFHRPKQDHMQATSYRGNYSAVSNCSDTDAREARPSCKFTRNNFLPRPKTDIVSNEGSTKYSFSATGNGNNQMERLWPRTSAINSFSVKDYREHDHSSANSSDVRTTGTERDAFPYPQKKVNLDRDIAEATYPGFSMTEKCPRDGNQHFVNQEEDHILKSTAPSKFDNEQSYIKDDFLEEINQSEELDPPTSTDDQSTAMNEPELGKDRCLTNLLEKSGSLGEFFDEKTSMISNSTDLEDEMIKADKHERDIQKDASQLLVLHESNSSDNDDEQSESILSSNNHNTEFSLQSSEQKSCESLSGVSDDDSRDSNTVTKIDQEVQKDKELLCKTVEQNTAFSLDADFSKPGDTRSYSSNQFSEIENKGVASRASSMTHSSDTDECFHKAQKNVSAEKLTLSQNLPCIGSIALSGILKNSAFKDNEHVHTETDLQQTPLINDSNHSLEKESSPENTTVVLSKDESILRQNDSAKNLHTVQGTRNLPAKNTYSSKDSSPSITSDNIPVDNDMVSQSELNSNCPDLPTYQDTGSLPHKETPELPSSQKSSPRVTHTNSPIDTKDIDHSESPDPNVLNTDVLLSHSNEGPLVGTSATSHTDQTCIITSITDINTQKDLSNLKSCLNSHATSGQENNLNSALFPDPHYSFNDHSVVQEKKEHVDFPEDAKDSFENSDFPTIISSEPGLLYGEPLSADESSCSALETVDVSHQLQEMHERTPVEGPMDQPERPIPQLTSSAHMRPFLHPVVILMNMETSDKMGSTYNCSNCLHKANSVDLLIEHHYCCHPMPSYQHCNTCDVYFMKSEDGEQHCCNQISTQKKKNCGPYRCSRCGLIFSRILHYVRHMRDHTGRTPYRCSGCGLYFSQSSSLNHHRRVPGRCKQSLKAKKTCTIPIKTETPTQKDVALNNSYESMKPCYVRLIDISKTNVCHYCGKAFSSAKRLKKHIYNVHKAERMSSLSEKDAPYKCPLCPRHFKYSYNRARHLRFCVRDAIYGGKKKVGDKYACPLCNATFTASCNRYRHIKLTCLRETLNRLARERLKWRQRSCKHNEQKIQSTDPLQMIQAKEEEAKMEEPQDLASKIHYKCSHCPAIFFHPSGKYRHMKKHELFKRTGKIIRYRKSALPKPVSSCDKKTDKNASQPDKVEENPKKTFRCRFCGLNFRILASLKRHEGSHCGDKPYRCLECAKGFKNLSHLIAHRVVHQKRIQCTVCKKVLPTIGELIQHRSSHLEKGMLQCPECPAQFQYPVYLLRHLVTHRNKDKKTQKPAMETQTKPKQCSESVKEQTGLKSLQCSLCKETFDDAHILRKHILAHISRSSSNQCPFCKKKFKTRHSLTRHTIRHTGEKAFSCANCGKQFYRSVYLKIHTESCKQPNTNPNMEANLSNPINKRLSCTICPRRFWKRIRLEMHIKGHKNKSLHICTKCGQYYGIHMLTRHKVMCVGTKEISLASESLDDNSESNSTEVNNGVQEKTSDSDESKLLPLKCQYCSKRFRYTSLLLRHTVTHTGLQPFQCMNCDQRFSSKTRWLNHEASCHPKSKSDSQKLKIEAEEDSASQTFPSEVEAELKCRFCTKTFIKARSLRHHILTHNEVKPYRCKACDSCFSRYDHLKVHQALCKSKKTRLEVRIPKISLEDVGKGWQSKFNLKSPDEQESFDCKVCLKSFTAENKLSRHITMFHTVKKFKCRYCGSAFSHEKTLKHHQKMRKCRKQRESETPLQETDKPTDNIIQNLDGIRKKILVRIQPLFNKDLKFVCSYCPRAFKNSWQLNVHTRLHTGERPYSCDQCGERFIRSDYLSRHKCKDKTQPSNVLCDRCGGFFSESQLENHKKACILKTCSPNDSKSKQPTIQSPPKGFSCAYCSLRFLLFSQLQEHFLTTHKQDTDTPPISTAPLQQLLSNIPKIKEEPVDELYGKASSNDVVLPIPDTGLAPDASDLLVCQECNMCFTNRAGLIGHQRVHSTRVPYVCKYCKRGFWNKTQLRNHYRKCRRGNQRQDIPIKAERDDAFISPKSKGNFETRAATTPCAKVLQTNVPCKEEPEDESTQSSYGNQAQSGNSSTEKKSVQYQCSECDKSFTDGLLLISHLEDHGREEEEKKSNKCPKCGRVFSNPGNLRRHMKLHVVHQKYFCPFCTKVCSSMTELEKHKATHDHSKPFTCKLCELPVATRHVLREHYISEHADDIFHCQWCSKMYSSKKSLSRHCKECHPKEIREQRGGYLQWGSVEQQSSSYVSTNGDSDEDQNLGSDSDSDSAPYFPCHVCGKTFPTSESLEDHQLCHLGKKPHECAECGKCFFQASQLQQHQRMHKSEFQCPTCGRGFVSLFALRNHKHSHGKSRPFRCPKCDLGFAGPTQLAEHMSTHREESFPCDICNKIFQCKSSRAEHRKTHTMSNEDLLTSGSKGELEHPKSMFGYTTEFKYRCGICSERFRDPEELSEHGCLEARERPYTCTECNKYFLHASHLKKHQITHQQPWSDREYPCNQCNSSFSSSQHFLSHLKTHVGTTIVLGQERDSSKGFICPVCHQCFSSATELIQHFPTHPDCSPEQEKAEQHTSDSESEEQEVLHPTTPIVYDCAECGKRFLKKEALLHHNCSLKRQEILENRYLDQEDASPTHEATGDEEEVDVIGEDLYRCQDCSVQFSSKSSLLEHQNTQHSKILRDYKCETCGKTFSKKRYLRKHELRQHGPKEYVSTKADLEKKFKCIQCRARFNTCQDLSNHMRLHAEKHVGEYRCDMCYKSFSKRVLLRQHQESHVGEVVYECTECDKAFAFPHLLEEHQLSHVASAK
ncbi:PREDICTED: uncharacterized protein LOC107091648 [Cyprinodon variegatus]|uniref:uncharacterized protein LOC107091648 n=1 Tax=Cyprinodon variegatus TaxID=28743 RepID=UPI0007427283|nr:PREDICTED: uncharacterized protein LOC107091648 [Cyprinodon variegatus]